MKTAVITCPSGLSFRSREILISDQDILADKRLVKSGEVVDALLGACHEETLEAGPYRFGTGKVRWGEVLQGDRLAALIRLRQLTHGDGYEFSARCPSRGCRARFDYRIDLNDLRFQDLSEESRAIVAAGGDFETHFDGTAVRFRLLTGADERKLQALMRGAAGKELSTSLAYRITSVDGVDAKDKRKWLEGHGLSALCELLAAFDEVDCGVDTDIAIDCPVCGDEVEIAVPFDDQFLLPRRRRKGGGLAG